MIRFKPSCLYGATGVGFIGAPVMWPTGVLPLRAPACAK
jgi:hypothetical protein